MDGAVVDAARGRRTALVPGAVGGMGASVCEALAEGGADLVLGVRRADERSAALEGRLRELGADVRVELLDAREADSITDWVRRGQEFTGRIDILANCLGWQDPKGFLPFVDQAEESWMRVLDVELIASLRLAQAVVPIMKAQGWGRIVTLGSDSAKVGEGGAAANSAARGGCSAFSKALAREVGRFGITVNMVCPGPTEGPLLSKLEESEHGARVVKKMISMIALKRAGTTREVAEAVAFLASDKASYITGQALSVSGGLTMC